ncbi:MAG: hypothetical protein L6Q99_21730 [Planctomycetes bacterium]|nr:hypothetical protein [Planctomycetota bacterium]
MEQSGPPRLADEGAQPISGCLISLGWLVGGNVLLAALAVLIARNDPWTLTTRDLLFWAVVVAVVLLRYLDLTRFTRRTADGDRATPRDFRRYGMSFGGFWLCVWLLGQSVGLDD